ncbi:MAG: hypothetical protein LAN64_00260 [Acidobacteriia bacterium]|nr:hypothetical protein [Terriglobia bacterium]
MRKTPLACAFILVLFSFTISSLAQVTASGSASEQAQMPRLVRFSGSIPHDGTVGITFALYKDATGGTPLWQEVQNVTPDANGSYSVLLGANSKDGVPTELFTTNEARWLGVQVEQEAEQPRVLLVSVPYALKSGDAETVGGHPLSDFVMTAAADASSGASGSTASSTTGGSTTTSGGSSTTKKSASAPAGTSAPVTTAGGTQNFLAKFDVTGTNLVNSLLFDNGFVGVNNSNPALHLGRGRHRQCAVRVRAGPLAASAPHRHHAA